MFKLNRLIKEQPSARESLADEYAEVAALSRDVEHRKTALRKEILDTGLDVLTGLHSTVTVVEKTRRTLPTEAVVKNLGALWVDEHKVEQTVKELHVTEN